MVQSASFHLSSTHVRVNAIAPGLVRTSILSTSRALAGEVGDKAHEQEQHALSKEEALQEFDNTFGQRGQSNASKGKSPYYYDRIGEPNEVANLGIFLASDLAAMVNGQNIVADCGKTAAAFGESLYGPVPSMTPI